MSAEPERIIQPIETYYNGRRFRSRLEARWAVFFDAIRIPWVYEPEGFKFRNQILYLPDFFLPLIDKNGAYFEVKPVRPSQLEINKCGWLAAHTGKPTYMFWGLVGHQLSNGYPSGQVLQESAMVFGPSEDGFDGYWADEQYAWCRCTECGRYGIEFQGWSGRICSHKDGDKKDANYECRSLMVAFDAANMARF